MAKTEAVSEQGGGLDNLDAYTHGHKLALIWTLGGALHAEFPMGDRVGRVPVHVGVCTVWISKWPMVG